MYNRCMMSMKKVQQAKPVLVQIHPLSASEQRKRELLTVYEEVLKKFDLKSFHRKYADNPVALATMHRFTSPEFLRIAGEITREQKRWNEQYGQVYEEEMRRLQERDGLLEKNLHAMQEETQRASEELQRMFDAHKPDLERLQEFSAKTAKELTRDLETIDRVTKDLHEPFAVAASALQSLQMSKVLTALDSAMVDNRQSLVMPLPTTSQERRLRSGEMIISTEDYTKFLQSDRERQEILKPNEQPRVETKVAQETIVWISVGDFKFCHEPLMLKIRDEMFRYENDGMKIKTEGEKNRRKALKTLAIFVPLAKQGTGNVSYTDLKGVVRALKVGEQTTARTQLSIARNFLKQIGSGYTITRLTEKKPTASKEPIALITR